MLSLFESEKEVYFVVSQKAKNGDVIIPINDKMVYTDFNKYNPGISKIIGFDLVIEKAIDGCRAVVFYEEKGKLDDGTARRIIEETCGKGHFTEYIPSMFGSSERYDRQRERGQRRSDAFHSKEQLKRADFRREPEGAGDSIASVDSGTSNNKNPQTKLKTDSAGISLTQNQIEYFKDSKIVDDRGRLLELYHGTNLKTFKRLNKLGAWLTPDKTYAKKYADYYDRNDGFVEYTDEELPFE